jgi:hypothetical protein
MATIGSIFFCKQEKHLTRFFISISGTVIDMDFLSARQAAAKSTSNIGKVRIGDFFHLIFYKMMIPANQFSIC